MAGGGGTNTISQTTLPAWLQPYMTDALTAGQQLYQAGGPVYYQGQQVANLTPEQLAGISQTENVASTPSASQGAQSANRFETSGALLNPSANPYLQGTFNQAANAVQSQLASEFAGAGSNVINSLPVQADEMNNLATQLYGGAYNQGLQTMTQASALAPGIDQGAYLPGQMLEQAGGTLQNQSQNDINAAMQAYNYNSTLPMNMLSWYSGLLGQNGSPFKSASSSTSGNPNAALQDAGLGIAGLGAAGSTGLLSALGSLFGAGGGAAAEDAAFLAFA
jgi:hypothetical protein